MDTHQNAGLAAMKSYGNVRTFLERSPIRIGLALLAGLSITLTACGGGGEGSTSGLPAAAATPTPSIIEVTPTPINTPSAGESHRVIMIWGNFDPTITKDNVTPTMWQGQLTVNDAALSINPIGAYWFDVSDTAPCLGCVGQLVSFTSGTTAFFDGLDVQILGGTPPFAGATFTFDTSVLLYPVAVNDLDSYADYFEIDPNHTGFLVSAIYESAFPGKGFAVGDFFFESGTSSYKMRAILLQPNPSDHVLNAVASINATFTVGEVNPVAIAGAVQDTTGTTIAAFSGTLDVNTGKLDGTWDTDGLSPVLGELHARVPVLKTGLVSDSVAGYFLGYTALP